MSARQACPQCGDGRIVLHQVEGYEPTCLACLPGLVRYHLENVHDAECGTECAEQLLAFEILRQRMGEAHSYMLVRINRDGGHDQVVFRGDGVRMGDLLRGLGLTPAALSGRLAVLGVGNDGHEYEAVRV